MSRIGKLPIPIPAGVEVTVQEQHITVKGPKGSLEYQFDSRISAVVADDLVTVSRTSDEAADRSLHGLTRALINNMIIGVSQGFEKRLEIIGVGYRVQTSGQKITLNLGYSHPIEFNAPTGIELEMDKDSKNVLVIRGIDKQVVGEVAANIRKYRPPEPYKGKGIRYVGEHVVRKAGKTASSKG